MCTLGFLNLSGIGPCRLINQIQDTMNQIVLNLPFCKQHCHYYCLWLYSVFLRKKKSGFFPSIIASLNIAHKKQVFWSNSIET